MMHFTYLLFSDELQVFYKGYTNDPNQRFISHLNNSTKYTARAKDWKLVYVKEHENKKDALQHEQLLKRQNHKYLNWVISQPENIVSKFLDSSI